MDYKNIADVQLLIKNGFTESQAEAIVLIMKNIAVQEINDTIKQFNSKLDNKKATGE